MQTTKSKQNLYMHIIYKEILARKVTGRASRLRLSRWWWWCHRLRARGGPDID